MFMMIWLSARLHFTPTLFNDTDANIEDIKTSQLS